MMTMEKQSTETLINRTGLKKTKFADEAQISHSYLNRALNGYVISEAYAHRITNAINRLLGTKYTPDDLDITYK